MHSDFHTFRGYQLRLQQEQLLTPSMEDYLEMIYRNCMADGYVRVSQLAGQLNVRSSSVTKIVKKLAELKFLRYRPYGIIQLTEQGTEIGKFLLQRHDTLKEFLAALGVNTTLLQDTELLEHHISIELLENINIFLLFLAQNPDWLKRYTQFRQAMTAAPVDT